MKVIQNLKINWKLTDRQKDGLCYASIFVVMIGVIGIPYMEFGIMPASEFISYIFDNIDIELKNPDIELDKEIYESGLYGIVIIVFIALFGSIFILVEIASWFTNLFCKGLGINTDWSKQK